MNLTSIHHIAIIVSDYQASKSFYTATLGFQILRENYREERRDWKLDLKCGDVELEVFAPNTDGSGHHIEGAPYPPTRPTHPEACGLRHLAFRVEDVEEVVRELEEMGIECEPVRTDTYTGKYLKGLLNSK